MGGQWCQQAGGCSSHAAVAAEASAHSMAPRHASPELLLLLQLRRRLLHLLRLLRLLLRLRLLRLLLLRRLQ